MTHVEKALKIRHTGRNCCQAVLAAYEDELKMSFDDLMALGSAFGLGMGAMKGNCGALCGAEMALGMLRYNGMPIRREASSLFDEFVERCGSSICAEIKGATTGKILCSCDDCIKNAAALVEAHL